MTVLESTLSVENRYRQLFRQRLVILAVIFIAIIASLLLDFTLGPSGLPLHSLIKTLMHPSGATNGMRVIVWDIRLPYALMALLVGMALGLAGAEMQTILNNSLASPFTLGVSSAAAFGAALAIVLGIGIPGVPESGFIPANAFLFALLSALLTPNDALRALQDEQRFTELMVRQEALKTMPFGDVWDEYCRSCNVPVGTDWFETVQKYERDVLSKRV